MSIHHMVRMQSYLDEAIDVRLRDLARKQRRTSSKLVRDALVRAYGEGDPDKRLDSLQAIRGLWQDREDMASSRAYLRRQRLWTFNRRH